MCGEGPDSSSFFCEDTVDQQPPVSPVKTFLHWLYFKAEVFKLARTIFKRSAIFDFLPVTVAESVFMGLPHVTEFSLRTGKFPPASPSTADLGSFLFAADEYLHLLCADLDDVLAPDSSCGYFLDSLTETCIFSTNMSVVQRVLPFCEVSHNRPAVPDCFGVHGFCNVVRWTLVRNRVQVKTCFDGTWHIGLVCSFSLHHLWFVIQYSDVFEEYPPSEVAAVSVGGVLPRGFLHPVPMRFFGIALTAWEELHPILACLKIPVSCTVVMCGPYASKTDCLDHKIEVFKALVVADGLPQLLYFDCFHVHSPTFPICQITLALAVAAAKDMAFCRHDTTKGFICARLSQLKSGEVIYCHSPQDVDIECGAALWLYIRPPDDSMLLGTQVDTFMLAASSANVADKFAAYFGKSFLGTKSIACGFFWGVFHSRLGCSTDFLVQRPALHQLSSA